MATRKTANDVANDLSVADTGGGGLAAAAIVGTPSIMMAARGTAS